MHKFVRNDNDLIIHFYTYISTMSSSIYYFISFLKTIVMPILLVCHSSNIINSISSILHLLYGTYVSITTGYVYLFLQLTETEFSIMIYKKIKIWIIFFFFKWVFSSFFFEPEDSHITLHIILPFFLSLICLYSICNLRNGLWSMRWATSPSDQCMGSVPMMVLHDWETWSMHGHRPHFPPRGGCPRWGRRPRRHWTPQPWTTTPTWATTPWATTPCIAWVTLRGQLYSGSC